MKSIISITLLFMNLSVCAMSFPQDFVFGVANAPGQVEDNLSDIWLAWGKQGKVKSWGVTPNPELRLEFWSKPEIEINLAKNLGVQSFRMGIDWGRVMISPGQFDEEAISRYREIIQLVRKSGMKIMMTLWHHSVPVWVQESGGWHNEKKQKGLHQLFSTDDDRVSSGHRLVAHLQ